MKAQGCLRGRVTSPRVGTLKHDASQKIRKKWSEPEDKSQKIKAKEIRGISGASQEIKAKEIRKINGAPEDNEIKKRGSGSHTPMTLLLIRNDTPAVTASAIQNAFQTPTAPKK